MTAPATLILYSRPGCHLCELASQLLAEQVCDWHEVNIEDDPKLEEAYGLVIPVVTCEQGKKKLFYPFGSEQLSRFLEEIGQ